MYCRPTQWTTALRTLAFRPTRFLLVTVPLATHHKNSHPPAPFNPPVGRSPRASNSAAGQDVKPGNMLVLSLKPLRVGLCDFNQGTNF